MRTWPAHAPRVLVPLWCKIDGEEITPSACRKAVQPGRAALAPEMAWQGPNQLTLDNCDTLVSSRSPVRAPRRTLNPNRPHWALRMHTGRYQFQQRSRQRRGHRPGPPGAGTTHLQSRAVASGPPTPCTPRRRQAPFQHTTLAFPEGSCHGASRMAYATNQFVSGHLSPNSIAGGILPEFKRAEGEPLV